MSRWLNCCVQGKLSKSELAASVDDALSSLRRALTRHEQRGEKVREMCDHVHGGRAYWEVFRADGRLVAGYWLSEDNEGA